MPAALLSDRNQVEETSPIDGDRWIADRVFERLGRPRDLFRIQIRNVWGDKFRVNVYRETDATQALPRVEMTDSFFVTTDHETMTTRPAIEKKY
ncbi:hypothetical protein K2X85_19375 [bacterium]|jgi:hypothetical protein|nr:hypothetical protein [bacterium]